MRANTLVRLGFLSAVLCGIVFALVSVLVLILKRGAFGRRLAALRDSQAACATLGARGPLSAPAAVLLLLAVCVTVGFRFGLRRRFE